MGGGVCAKRSSSCLLPLRANGMINGDNHQLSLIEADTLFRKEPLRTQGCSLSVHCLGPFRVYTNNKLISEWYGFKGQAIFKYLIAHHEKPISSDILMDVLWPDANAEAARRNLHHAIYSLRKALRQHDPSFYCIHLDHNSYCINPELSVWIDFVEFEHHAQAGRKWEAVDELQKAIAEYGVAESLYLGDFLEEDPYEEWTGSQRQHLQHCYLQMTDRLSEMYMQQGEHANTIALCQRILARDKCHEPAHRRLMQCYLAQGQRHLAVHQFHVCEETLKSGVNLPLSEETLLLYKQIHTP